MRNLFVAINILWLADMVFGIMASLAWGRKTLPAFWVLLMVYTVCATVSTYARMKKSQKRIVLYGHFAVVVGIVTCLIYGKDVSFGVVGGMALVLSIYGVLWYFAIPDAQQ
jgi:hypothetical protein